MSFDETFLRRVSYTFYTTEDLDALDRMKQQRPPTDSELMILAVLWERGPSTVREVQQGLPKERNVGYTTVLKLLQIMHEKHLVQRDESLRAHVYSALAARDNTQRDLVQNLLAKGFGGSRHDLVLRALESKPCTAEELNSIRKLLETFDKGEIE